MKLTLLSASLGAIPGYFIEIYLLVSSQPNISDDLLLLSEGSVSPFIFALPIIGAIVGATILVVTASIQRAIEATYIAISTDY